MENQTKFVCPNCGTVHDNDLELLSLNGVNFCGKCSDNFHFLKDEHLGFIALREVDRETYNNLPKGNNLDSLKKI